MKALHSSCLTIAALALACGGGGDFGDGGADVTHPPSGRLMITAERMTELEAMVAANDPLWQQLKVNVDAEMDTVDQYRTGHINIALVYLMTGEQAYADAAWIWAKDTMDTADVPFDSYLHFGDHMRSVAVVLNYCHDGLSAAQRDELADYLEHWTNELWFDNQGNGWGLDDPGNNYHMAFLEGTAFAGYALSEAGRAVGADYIAILLDKLDSAAGVVNYLNTRAAGGDWPEGANYGQRSKQRLYNALGVIAGAGGTNYFTRTSFFAESVYYAIHALQPGFEFFYPSGDLARESNMAVSPYDREYIQAATYWSNDADGRGAGQSFMNDIVADYTGPGFNLRQDYFRDFLFGTDIAPATAISEMPLFYRAPGTEWVTARSSWADDATCFAVTGMPFLDQSHGHLDVGSFTLWKQSWQAVDASTFSDSGGNWASDAHNMIHVPGSERRGGDSPGMVAAHDDERVTYVQVDISNMHRYRPGTDEAETMLNEYTRELVYLKPDTLVVYDRVDPKPSGTGYSWRLHFAAEPAPANGRYAATSGGGGMALVQLAGGAATVHRDSDLEGGASSAWRVEQAASGDGRFLNVVAVASGGAPALTATAVTSSDNVAGAVTGNQVVVVSSNARGAAVSLPFSYLVGDAGDHTHTLVNLTSSVDVDVIRGGGTTTVTVSSGSDHDPNEAGLVSFSDAD